MMNTTANFLLSDLKSVQPIDGWQDFMHDGKGFLKTAVTAHGKRKHAFTPVILYNLIAMAIEKFVMAALMRYGALPYNHTMKDLVEAMDETFPGSINDIRESLLQFDEFQDICDLEGFSITPPEMEEIPAMLVLAGKMQNLATEKINDNGFKTLNHRIS